MKRFHIAIGVADIASAVLDYSQRLGAEPVSMVPGEYALWRTTELNFSIRKVAENAGAGRHIGFEDDSAVEFATSLDHNGLMWENFSAQHQADEINKFWPQADYTPRLSRKSFA